MNITYFLDDSFAHIDYFRKNDYVAMYTCAPRDDFHHHPEYFEIGYIADGVSVHTLNERQTKVGKGDFFIIDKVSRHQHSVIKPVCIVNILFHPRFIDATLSECRDLKELVSHFSISYLPQNINLIHRQVFHDADGQIGHLIEEIAKEQFEARSGNRTMIRTYLIQLLVHVMRMLGDQISRQYSAPVKYMIDLVERQYSSPISLASIAEALHYSPSYLFRLFSKEIGKSFSDYVKQCRMVHAAYYLLNTSLPIYRIAESVGYKDLHFFHQLFAERYGQTPGTYRRKALQNQRRTGVL